MSRSKTAPESVRPSVRTPSRTPGQAGFTLMEVLVAVVIVGLTVTVFFQLLSASLRLEARSRRAAEAVVEARMLFDQLAAMDVRGDDFPWSGEADGRAWTVRMHAVDVSDPLDARRDEPFAVRTPSELYRLVLDFRAQGGRTVTLTLYRDFEPGYLSDDFKNEHVRALPEDEEPPVTELRPEDMPRDESEEEREGSRA